MIYGGIHGPLLHHTATLAGSNLLVFSGRETTPAFHILNVELRQWSQLSANMTMIESGIEPVVCLPTRKLPLHLKELLHDRRDHQPQN